MSLFSIDMAKCLKCGACANVCVSRALVMGENGPQAVHEICIGCGHCVAVCPTAAIDNAKAPLAQQEAVKVESSLSPRAAVQLLRQRRSCRSYLDVPIPKDGISDLLDVARYAPTGDNSQGISFVVIDSKAVLEQIKKAAVSHWEKTIAARRMINPDNEGANLNQRMVDRFRLEGEDTVLWGAPVLILALADEAKSVNPRESAILSIIYAHIYASVIRLGSCWAGAVENALFDKWQPMLDALSPHVDVGSVAGALMVGYPTYQFKRLVERDPLQLEWIS